MKYIKRFNEELKASTYRSAATKLKQIGHSRRSSALDNWATSVEKSLEEKEKQETIDLLSKYGSFKMDFIKNKNVVFTGNFYIAISGMDHYNLKDTYFDMVDNNGTLDSDLIINFELGFIPADEETENKLQEEIKDGYIKEYLYYGLYWNMSFGISIINKGEKYINPSGYYYYDRMDRDSFMFHDRKEATKFRKLLSDAFIGNNDWGKSKWYESLKHSIIKAFKDETYSKLPEDVFNEESYQKIANSIKTLSLNKLYSE